MVLLLNYADYSFTDSQKLNSQTGVDVGGVDEVMSCSPSDIDSGFRRRHRRVLSQVRGAGYWLWKPYLIAWALRRLSDGDFLVYADAGYVFEAPVEPLLRLCRTFDQDIIVFRLPFRERCYTKRDLFTLMDCDAPEFTETVQRLTFSIWRKSPFSVGLAEQFLHLAEDERALTDLPNQLGQDNYPGFIEHRHDQSILSLLTKKHGLRAFRDPRRYGNQDRDSDPDSDYGKIVTNTRRKNRFSFLRRNLTRALGRVT